MDESNDESNTKNIIIYCVFHKQFSDINNPRFTYFGVNETYPKNHEQIANRENVILEYQLDKYNPFLQKRGYMETSAYLHVYWNYLYTGKDMVGFSQYDMKHYDTYENLDKNTIYLLNTGQAIVSGGAWNPMMCPQLRNLDFLIRSYNSHFCKSYSMKELENMPLSLWQTNIYPVAIYEKLCKWLEVLVEDIYPWSNLPHYETHFGSIGGYTERALSIFNAFEIYEGTCYSNLSIDHFVGDCEKEQYNVNSFLNFYSQDIHSRFVADITGKYASSGSGLGLGLGLGLGFEYSMFKSQCYVDGVTYNCERLGRNNQKVGLICSRSSDVVGISHVYGEDIEAEDPRLVHMDSGAVYIVFICLSPYPGQTRCIAITPFDEWNPVFLQVENMQRNSVEKNWAPFVKNGQLYFVYNYDPLVILQYDFNTAGICRVVFTQDGVQLPIDTSSTYLRGGSNLIPYKDGFYIGGCHSRIHNNDAKNCFEHYTHVVLLNTNSWKLVYVSKPVMYLLPEEMSDTKFNSWWVTHSPDEKCIDTLHNIIVDKTPHIIQDPVSIYCRDDRYYITVNIRDSVSFRSEELV